jgi:hypothetical protein
VLAVAAAIGAAFVAGVVAVFREHRIQERQLLVAARVVDETLARAEQSIGVAISKNGWGAYNSMPTHESFKQCWEGSRGDLAGHLTQSEWKVVTRGVTAYEASRSTNFDGDPNETEIEGTLLAIKRGVREARDGLKPYVSDRLTLRRQWQRRRTRGDWSKGGGEK